MKLTDDIVLGVTGANTGLWSLAALGLTRSGPLEKFTGMKASPFLMSGIAIANGGMAARDVVLAANKDAVAKTKKNALRTNAAVHGAWAMYMAVHGAQGKEVKKEVGLAAAAVNLAIGGLALYQGLRKEEKPKPVATAAKPAAKK
uniref:Uncharacterized protein n=1 Tax=Chlamydomonas leiostraca TaxID=1034604 RepID=A0A7S0RNN3_9CHLO|mmetsp:Transcript_27554/g.70187  ORF Transcript_27554/g.70187 Transcript_27554/m.70187 type:complete len:145 (+) Transcript_27554:279-713(+)|eukprot:CAMPEP_0202859696 /NCGR_PEP_ID=MMETSP1391-20130828/1699_1 /ASSEMBLY_ACC=CAM_ASM_000867 /TAXON_ID=1034604 /ORGANISM="Chlamydomonas leiostraca, Strain SAG 11-49" /LENGTH=144 /DNA_ID=CAMNT_0049538753 /DNA_START=217 /DNA_END=651 /DNA_ORIENTATION=-